MLVFSKNYNFDFMGIHFQSMINFCTILNIYTLYFHMTRKYKKHLHNQGCSRSSIINNGVKLFFFFLYKMRTYYKLLFDEKVYVIILKVAFI